MDGVGMFQQDKIKRVEFIIGREVKTVVGNDVWRNVEHCGQEKVGDSERPKCRGQGLYLCGYWEVNRKLGSRATASQVDVVQLTAQGNIRELIPYKSGGREMIF